MKKLFLFLLIIPFSSLWLQAQTVDIEMVKVIAPGDTKPFQIGKYEVTQAQWVAVMGNNPSQFKGDNLPVENVSWNDVQEFIKKLNAKTGKKYRLPTEPEWYLASIGGNAGLQQITKPKYSGSENIDAVAWYSKNSKKTTHAVGTKQPNLLGIFDMSGNVYEWCSNLFDNTNEYAARGGSWFNEPAFCEVSHRNHAPANMRAMHIGFRLASEIETATEKPQQPRKYKLTLKANPENAGATTGSGEYLADKDVAITATANEGWKFVEWEGIGKASATNYKMPARDITLTAIFEKEEIPQTPQVAVIPQKPNPTPPDKPEIKPETPTTPTTPKTPTTSATPQGAGEEENMLIKLIREREKFPLKLLMPVPDVAELFMNGKEIAEIDWQGCFVKTGMMTAKLLKVWKDLINTEYSYYKFTLTDEGKKYIVSDTENGDYLVGADLKGVWKKDEHSDKYDGLDGQNKYQGTAYAGTADLYEIVEIIPDKNTPSAEDLKQWNLPYKYMKSYTIRWTAHLTERSPFMCNLGYAGKYDPNNGKYNWKTTVTLVIDANDDKNEIKVLEYKTTYAFYSGKK
ncbi:MAG: SUMF1/EgtB/PvdO family nonheme iron enzyme [Prevotellaceae bacterium]|jgi:hypothetical protein|nr:SUMF1/EgtB/PvdO family nonheme iron enzyme [Prevotellaceae bacterium]